MEENMVITKRVSTDIIIVFTILITYSISHAGIPEPGIIYYGKVLDESGHLLTSGELTLTLTHASTNQSVIKTTQLREIKDNDINYSYSLVIPIETDITGYPVSENAIELSTSSVTFNRSAKIENTAISMIDSIQLTNKNIGSVENFLISKNGDTDNDGLPDAWEEKIIDFNGSDSISLITHVHPEGDFDGDGVSNYDEYLCLSDPTKANNTDSVDLNNDAKITIVDAIIALEIITHVLQKTDINVEINIEIDDVIVILRHITNLK